MLANRLRMAGSKGIFVAVGGSGSGSAKIATSPDGINWTQRANGFTSTVMCVAYSDGKWVAADYNGNVGISTDGINWSVTAIPNGGNALRGVTYSKEKNRWVVVGILYYIYSSPDGVNWAYHIGSSGAGVNHNDVAYGAGKFITATDGDNEVRYSTDGMNWNIGTQSLASSKYCIYFDGTQFIMGGYQGVLYTSPDGVTWTSRTNEFGTSSIYGITSGVDRSIICGEGGKVSISVNGTSWSLQTTPFTTSNIMYGAAYGNGLFVVGGDGGELATSPNGITWTLRTSSFGTSTIRAIVYGGV